LGKRNERHLGGGAKGWVRERKNCGKTDVNRRRYQIGTLLGLVEERDRNAPGSRQPGNPGGVSLGEKETTAWLNKNS